MDLRKRNQMFLWAAMLLIGSRAFAASVLPDLGCALGLRYPHLGTTGPASSYAAALVSPRIKGIALGLPAEGEAPEIILNQISWSFDRSVRPVQASVRLTASTGEVLSFRVPAALIIPAFMHALHQNPNLYSFGPDEEIYNGALEQNAFLFYAAVADQMFSHLPPELSRVLDRESAELMRKHPGIRRFQGLVREHPWRPSLAALQHAADHPLENFRYCWRGVTDAAEAGSVAPGPYVEAPASEALHRFLVERSGIDAEILTTLGHYIFLHRFFRSFLFTPTFLILRDPALTRMRDLVTGDAQEFFAANLGNVAAELSVLAERYVWTLQAGPQALPTERRLR